MVVQIITCFICWRSSHKVPSTDIINKIVSIVENKVKEKVINL